MNLSKVSVNRPVTSVMAILAIILIGCVSIIGIPIDLFPDIEMPMAIVYTAYPNAAPEEVETMVTIPLENSLSSVENLDSVSSQTGNGSSIVLVSFQSDTDMNFATLNMREKVDLVKDYLPDDAGDPMIIRMSMDMTPVVQLYASSETYDLATLNQMVEDELTSYFERADGVASVSTYGGILKEVNITFDQEKLVGYGLNLSTVSTMLSAENLNMPSGEVNKGDTSMSIRTIGKFESVDDIRMLPLTLSDGSSIRLSDVATVEEAYSDADSISRVDGETAIGISVSKQSTANTVQVSRSVQKVIDSLEDKYPEVTFTTGYDSADYIRSAVMNVAKSAILGALLAALVIFLFLRSVGPTMVIIISIPTAIFATFCLMRLADMTLNLMTLGALTLALGMLVDNSIVVTENIFRLHGEEGGSPKESAIRGSTQVGLAVAASTLTSLVVFLPLALAGGIAGMMLKDFSLTFCIALTASIFVALSIVPMLSSKLLGGHSSTDYIRIGRHRHRYRLLPRFARMVDALQDFYSGVISRALKKRKRTLVICLIIFVISIALITITGMEFFPASDEGMFTISASMPYGSSIEQQDKIMTQVEDIVMDIPELRHCGVDVGTTSIMSSGSATVSVMLTPKEERSRSTAEILKDVEQQCADITGAELTFADMSSMTSMMGSDLSLTIRGDDLDTLKELAETTAADISKIPGVEEADTSIEDGDPELRVTLNRNVASYYGVSAYSLASSLSSSLNGTSSTDLEIDGNEIAIRLSLDGSYGDSVENMKQILVNTNYGTTVPVGQIADITYDNSPSQITRENQQRFATVNVSISGDDLASVSEKVLDYMNSYAFPDGYRFEKGGLYEEMMDSFGDLLKALAAAVGLVFMVMAAQFESILMSLIVMASIPFAMSGAFLLLFLTGNTLSLSSFAGLIILVGIVVNNAILLVEFIRINRSTMERDKAIINAGRYRLRPILMTTLTTVVGMFPLSLGLGDGGEMMAPLAISIIGGLIGSTLVALILIPVLYAIVDDKRRHKKEKKELREKKILALEEQWEKEDGSDVSHPEV